MSTADRLEISAVVQNASLGDQLSFISLELLLLLPSESSLVTKEIVLFVCQKEVVLVLWDHLVKTLTQFYGSKTTFRLSDLVLQQLRPIIGRGNQVLDFLIINAPVAFSDPMAHFLVLHLNLNMRPDLLWLLQHLSLLHLAALRAVHRARLRLALL